MRIVVTGASGFVGQMLVPKLRADGAELILVGRAPDQLTLQYPGQQVSSYDAMQETAKGADLLIHLAVHNNNAAGTFADFEAVNVNFMSDVLNSSIAAGVKRFVHISTTHSLDADNTSAYAESKRKAEYMLECATGIETRTLYLPSVHGDKFSGKLSFLNAWPRALVRVVFPVVAALKATVHIDTLTKHVLAGADNAIISEGQERNKAYKVLVFFINWGFALSVLLLLWWALLIVWVMIRVTSPGPGLFTQTRIGLHGKPFKIYKFRTMSQGTKEAGTHEVSASAVTPIGAFLRRTKLDELPQIINIFKGEIGLIGPRPCLPVQETLIAERTARGVLSVLPGISGLAQIEGIDMSDPVRLSRRDRDYVALRSVALDLKILVSTIFGRGRGDRTVN